MSGKPTMWIQAKHRLGIEPMDQTHQEFVERVNDAVNAKGDAFTHAFCELVRHTEQHFEDENQLMVRYQFPAIEEHRAEHFRVLGELHQLEKRVTQGATLLAKAWLTEQLPLWFDLHAQTMDSALASHIKVVAETECVPA